MNSIKALKALMKRCGFGTDLKTKNDLTTVAQKKQLDCALVWF